MGESRATRRKSHPAKKDKTAQGRMLARALPRNIFAIPRKYSAAVARSGRMMNGGQVHPGPDALDGSAAYAEVINSREATDADTNFNRSVIRTRSTAWI